MKTQKLVQLQKSYYKLGKTKDIDFRIRQLKRLYKGIQLYEKQILSALKQDLNKSDFEAFITEIGMALEEISHTIKHLRQWAKPSFVKTPVTQLLGTSKIYQEPYGVVLIIAPWNYPFLLSIQPLISAIAAGNCCIIKPSEYSMNTSLVLSDLIASIYPKQYIAVVNGGKEVSQELLEEAFDFIFYTGGLKVGTYVMTQAAKHLTPVCLELGGKSPCIVDETANLKIAAKRIVWGKFLNAGQTCVAPDYLLVHKDVKQELLCYMKHYVGQFYQGGLGEEMPKIIHNNHYSRLMSYMDNGKLYCGGYGQRESLQIAPTILTDINWDSPIMQEEIFGPILPVIEYEDLNQAIAHITDRPKPLALYLFTESKKNKKKVLNQVSFGGGCVNETIMHLATSELPFGGVGTSGMGAYHGHYGYELFSHQKGLLDKSSKVEFNFRYPPYQKIYEKFIRLVLR